MSNSTVPTSGLRKFYYYLTENIHPYSLIVVIVLDLIWNIPELAIGYCAEVVLMGMIFVITFVAVNAIQINIAGDEKNVAQTKALVFGILAAAPFSVVTLIFGGLAGLLKLIFGYDRYAMLVGKLVMEWAKLEGDVNSLLPGTYDLRNDTSKQIGKKLQYLVENNRISRSFFESEINPIRAIRNKVTHPFENGLPTEPELETAFANLQFVRQNLRRGL